LILCILAVYLWHGTETETFEDTSPSMKKVIRLSYVGLFIHLVSTWTFKSQEFLQLNIDFQSVSTQVYFVSVPRLMIAMGFIAGAQVDDESMKKLVQYGILLPITVIWNVCNVSDAFSNVNVQVALIWAATLWAQALIHARYQCNCSKTVLRCLYFAYGIGAYIGYFHPGMFIQGFLPFMSPSSTGHLAAQLIALQFVLIALVLISVSQNDEDSQRTTLQYVLAALLVEVVGMYNLHPTVDFASIVFILMIFFVLYGSHLRQRFNFKCFSSPSTPETSKASLRRSQTPMGVKSPGKKKKN